MPGIEGYGPKPPREHRRHQGAEAGAQAAPGDSLSSNRSHGDPDGKWVSYDPDSIRPYKDGMVLKTKDAGSTTTVTGEEVLEFLRGLVSESGGPINPLAALSRGTDKFGASYSDVYRALKDSGKIVIDGGKLTVG